MIRRVIDQINRLKHPDRYLIAGILVIGAILRFYRFWEIPFTYDEFSALFRTRFDNFGELIRQGVMVDTHPAGVQVFLWIWVKLFGEHEMVVKLPFMLMGLASVWLIYRIGSRWFNPTVGLIAASYLSFIQFTVMYSQIARPYSSGLFLALLMIYFWTKVLGEGRREKYSIQNSNVKSQNSKSGTENWKLGKSVQSKNQSFNHSIIHSINHSFTHSFPVTVPVLGYVLAGSLCTYNHHFSLLFAFIVGVTGLFFLNHSNRWRYLLANLAIILLYLPHLPVFFTQFGMGGIGDWLQKPRYDFFFDYIKYIFHFSVFSYLLVLILVSLGLYWYYDAGKSGQPGCNQGSFFRYMLVSLAWFLVPYLVGFFYSRYVNPVIQFSVLIFSFPFLFFVLFGWIRETTPVRKGVFVALIAMISVTSLVLERKHYDLFYRSPYKEMLTEARDAVDSLGAKNCLVILDTKPKINQYYLDKLNLHDLSFIPAGSIGNRGKLASFLHACDRPYLIYGCISAVPWENYAIMNREYPWLLRHITWAGGDFYVFSRERTGDMPEGWNSGDIDDITGIQYKDSQKPSEAGKIDTNATRNESTPRDTPPAVTATSGAGKPLKQHQALSPEASNAGYHNDHRMKGNPGRKISHEKALAGLMNPYGQVSGEYFRGFVNTFEPPATEWGYVDTANLSPLNPIEGDTSWVDDEGLEFSPTFRKPLWEMIRSGSDIIDIWVDMEAPLVFPGAWLVATVMSGDEYIYWNSAPAGDFFRPGGKGRLFYSLRMCDIDLRHPDLVMTTFIWNPAKGKYKIDHFTVMVRRGNPFIYGLYRKVPIGYGLNSYVIMY